jgi:hypothetical protein
MLMNVNRVESPCALHVKTILVILIQKVVDFVIYVDMDVVCVLIVGGVALNIVKHVVLILMNVIIVDISLIGHVKYVKVGCGVGCNQM